MDGLVGRSKVQRDRRNEQQERWPEHKMVEARATRIRSWFS